MTVGGQLLHRATGDSNAGDSPNATKVWRDVTVVTSVLDSGGADVTNGTVPSGSVVHDRVVVTGLPTNNPVPAGTVTFTLYNSGTCDPASGTVMTDVETLDANGVALSVGSPMLGGGPYGFQATFAGDAPHAYPSGTGPCEPFTVTVPQVGPCVLGYPDSSNPPRSSVVFNESTVLVAANVFGTGAGQHVGVFYTDEHALTLGVEPGVTPYPGSPPNGGQANPSVGNKAATDGPAGRSGPRCS